MTLEETLSTQDLKILERERGERERGGKEEEGEGGEGGKKGGGEENEGLCFVVLPKEDSL